MHDRSRFLLILCLGGACLLSAVPAAGQIIYGQEAAGNLDIIGTHWKMTLDQNEVTIDQWAIPAGVFVPLRENLEARVIVGYATTTVKQLGQEFNLQGLSDMRLQVTHAFARDRLLAGVGLNLPVGHKALNLDEEWVVMNYLSQSFLSFPVRNLGEGFGLNLMFGGATELGDNRVGATATYDMKGSYEAYLGEEKYNPGNALNLTAGLQRELGPRLFSGDVTLTVSADDKQGGVPVFSRGEQLAFHAGLSGGSTTRRYRADATYLARGRNTAFDPAGVLLQQLKVYGNEFIVAGSHDWTSQQGWTYGPAADLRLIAGNEIGLGKSTILGLDGHVSRALTSTVNLGLALKYFTGSTHAGEVDLSGFQAWLTASGTF